MNLELDLACIQLALAMHNQAAVERYEETHSVSYQAQGWKALEGGSNDKRQTACYGLRGIRRMPHSICKPGHQKYTTVSGGIQ